MIPTLAQALINLAANSVQANPPMAHSAITRVAAPAARMPTTGLRVLEPETLTEHRAAASAGGTEGQGGSSGGQGGPGGALSGNSITAPSGAGGAGEATMNGMGALASDPANDPTQPAGSSNIQPAPSVNMDMTRPAAPRGNSSTPEAGSQQIDPVAQQRGRNWAWSEGPPTRPLWFVRFVSSVTTIAGS